MLDFLPDILLSTSTSSLWWIPFIMLYLIIIAVSGLFATGVLKPGAFRNRDYGVFISVKARIKATIVGIVIFIVIAGFVNIFAFVTSIASGETRDATPEEILTYYGLVPGESNDFNMGSQSTEISGTGSVEGGLFSINGDVNIESDTYLNVDFEKDERHTILQLKYHEFEYIIDNDAKPSIVLTAKSSSVHEQDEYWPQVVSEYGDCDVTFVYLLLQCVKPVTSVETEIDLTPKYYEPTDSFKFSLFAKKYVNGGTITLTQEMYDRLMAG